MKIYLGADHGGFRLKEKIKTWLTEWGIDFEDLGAHSLVEGDDYPDYAEPLARKVADQAGSIGILACRSGQGECIAANKVKGARAAVAWSMESATASRHDDNVNILCLASDHVGMAEQKRIIQVFISTPFGADERYERRLAKVSKIENHG